MKRRHKVTAGMSAAGLLALCTAGLEAWNAHQREDAALTARSDFECQVVACESQGGAWWRGECILPQHGRERQPK